MKLNELRALNADELHGEVSKRRQELLDLRIQTAVGHASNPRRIRWAKREIAQLLTLIQQKSEGAR